jgi:alpha-beta hydrolase superfamily lysophospholipase
MAYTHFDFNSSDGLKLFGRAWLTEIEKPKGIVHLVHGIGEHSGRYDHLGEAFNDNGYHFISFDHRGHGLSEGKRGHAPSFDHLLSDVGVFLDEVQRRYGPQPNLFLYGHSLGGLIVINFCLHRQTDLNGVIATAPNLRLAFKPPKFQLLFLKFMESIFPAFTMSSMLDQDALARDPAIVKAYQDDSFVHDRVSAKLAMDMLRYGEYAQNHAKDWNIPLLLMHGTSDRISSHKAGQEFAENVGNLVDLVLWQGYYHEIHNDIGKEEVIGKIISWVNNRSNEK